MDELNLKALAKINIGLDVLRKREDGRRSTYLTVFISKRQKSRGFRFPRICITFRSMRII